MSEKSDRELETSKQTPGFTKAPPNIENLLTQYESDIQKVAESFKALVDESERLAENYEDIIDDMLEKGDHQRDIFMDGQYFSQVYDKFMKELNIGLIDGNTLNSAGRVVAHFTDFELPDNWMQIAREMHNHTLAKLDYREMTENMLVEFENTIKSLSMEKLEYLEKRLPNMHHRIRNESLESEIVNGTLSYDSFFLTHLDSIGEQRAAVIINNHEQNLNQIFGQLQKLADKAGTLDDKIEDLF